MKIFLNTLETKTDAITILNDKSSMTLSQTFEENNIYSPLVGH